MIGSKSHYCDACPNYFSLQEDDIIEYLTRENGPTQPSISRPAQDSGPKPAPEVISVRDTEASSGSKQTQDAKPVENKKIYILKDHKGASKPLPSKESQRVTETKPVTIATLVEENKGPKSTKPRENAETNPVPRVASRPRSKSESRPKDEQQVSERRSSPEARLVWDNKPVLVKRTNLERRQGQSQRVSDRTQVRDQPVDSERQSVAARGVEDEKTTAANENNQEPGLVEAAPRRGSYVVKSQVRPRPEI